MDITVLQGLLLGRCCEQACWFYEKYEHYLEHDLEIDHVVVFKLQTMWPYILALWIL